VNEKTPIVLAWYEINDWQEWKRLCPDDMCETWNEWNEHAEDLLATSAHNRAIVHISTIKPHDFQDWAVKNNKTLNGHSRSEYAAESFKHLLFIKHKSPEKIPTKAEIAKLLRKAIREEPEIFKTDIWSPYLRRPTASICPIFRTDNNGNPEQFGSGVLIRIADHYFLVSAAHVMDEFNRNSILIPGKNHLIPLTGSYSVTELPDTGLRDDDHSDFGFLKFQSDMQHNLDDSLVFIDERDCDPMDTTEEKDAYTIIGYPSESSQSTEGTAETAITRISGEGTRDHRYAKLGLTPKSHLLIQYRTRKATTPLMKQARKVNFEGMSGGGVFAWSKNLPNPDALSQPNLVGVVTAYSEYHNVFISTRIHMIFSTLKNKFPDLPISRR